MDNNRNTYTRRVITMFASGDFAASTNDAVERWLVDDEGRDVKDAALEELWEEASLSHGGEGAYSAARTVCLIIIH